jgi:hypothetical protein
VILLCRFLFTLNRDQDITVESFYEFFCMIFLTISPSQLDLSVVQTSNYWSPPLILSDTISMDITRVQYYRTSVLLRIYLGFHIFQEVWLAEFTSREKYIGTAQVVFEGVVLPEVTSRKYVLRMPGFYPRFSFLL